MSLMTTAQDLPCPFGPRETRNSWKSHEAPAGQREGDKNLRDSYRVYLGHVKEIHTTSMLAVINGFDSLSLPWDLFLLEVLAVLGALLENKIVCSYEQK